MAELLDNLISLSSLEGAVLARAQPAAAPMWSLLAHFETQHTQSFCSIATAAMLLNVLGVPKPIDPVYAPYPYFTQANVLGECALAKPVTTNKNRAGGEHISVAFIGTHGATLAEWRDYVACWPRRCEHLHRHWRSPESAGSAPLCPSLSAPPAPTHRHPGGWRIQLGDCSTQRERALGFRPAPAGPSGRDRG